MRWLASRFLDADYQEELGILTPEVRARKAAEAAASSLGSDTAGPPNGGPTAAPTHPPSPRAEVPALARPRHVALGLPGARHGGGLQPGDHPRGGRGHDRHTPGR